MDSVWEADTQRRRWRRGRSHVGEGPAFQTRLLMRSRHPLMWPAASSSHPTLCRFSAAPQAADVRASFPWHRQVSSHRPVFPAGRLVILSTNWYYSGFCWQCSSPDWFSSPLYTICKPVMERPGRGRHVSPACIFSSPHWVNTNFSTEKIWLAQPGPVSSFVLKGNDTVQTWFTLEGQAGCSQTRMVSGVRADISKAPSTFEQINEINNSISVFLIW